MINLAQLIVREEKTADIAAIVQVIKAAFASEQHSAHNEQDIVNNLREQHAITLSLVAEYEGQVVGHIAFSEVLVDDKAQNYQGLAPVSVLPEFHGQGIGKTLIYEGLAQIAEQQASACVVLGEPAYYQKFGFKQVPTLIFEGVPAEYFMALSFSDNALVGGKVKYQPAFY